MTVPIYPAGLRLMVRASKVRRQDAVFQIPSPREAFAHLGEAGTDHPTVWDCRFVFTRAEVAVFREWFETDLLAGALPFDMPVRTEFGLLTLRCRFLDDGLLAARQIGNTWEFSARLATRDSTIPADAFTAWEGAFAGPIPLQVVVPGVPFELDLNDYFTGGVGPFIWSIVAGNLPPGITLNAATGIVSGETMAPAGAEFGGVVFKREDVYCICRETDPVTFQVLRLCLSGPTWTAGTVASVSQNIGVAWFKDRFVISALASGNMVVRYSTDGGATLQTGSIPATSVSGGSQIVTTPDYAFAIVNAVSGAVSGDGVNWSTVTLPSFSSRARPFTVGSAIWMPRFSSAGIDRSNNGGVAWSTLTVPNATWIHGAGNGSRIVLIGDTGAIYSDDNGTSWTAATIPSGWNVSRYPKAVFWTGTSFVATPETTADDFRFYRSATGAAWVAVDAPALGANRTWADLLVMPGLLMAFSSNTTAIAISTDDGLTWALAPNAAAQATRFAATDGAGRYVSHRASVNASYQHGIC